MKNRLIDLNDHLFLQIERLNEEGISDIELEREKDRAKAISGVATKIIDNAKVVLEAQKFVQEWGGDGREQIVNSFLLQQKETVLIEEPDK